MVKKNFPTNTIKKLTIIIPFYNSEKNLHNCLRSVCIQLKKEVEIILINDNSSDASHKIAKKFKRKYRQIKYIYLKERKGVSYCRNIGVKISHGEYIFFLDSDDQITKGSIRNILHNLYKYLNTEMFVTNFYLLKAGRKILNIVNKKAKSDEIIKNNETKSLLSVLNFNDLNRITFTCWQYIYQKKFLTTNRLYFNKLYVSEDWEFVIRALYFAKSYKFISKPIYIWRFVDINSHGKRTGYKACLSLIEIMRSVARFIFNTRNINFDEKKNFAVFFNRICQRFWHHCIILNLKEIKKLIHFIYKYRIFLKIIIFLNIPLGKPLIGSKTSIFNNIKKRIDSNDKLIKKLLKRINNERIIIFCASAFSKNILTMLNNYYLDADLIVDNNKNYIGQKINNILIKHSDFLKKNVKHYLNHKILICHQNTFSVKKIRAQLKKFKFNNNNIFQITHI